MTPPNPEQLNLFGPITATVSSNGTRLFDQNEAGAWHGRRRCAMLLTARHYQICHIGQMARPALRLRALPHYKSAALKARHQFPRTIR
jgi:hypothetical protein